MLRALGYAAAVVALVQLVRSMDLSGVGGLLRAAGPALPLVFGPFMVQLALESGSWRLLLGRLGHHVAWRAALRSILGAEGVRLAFPGGAAAGDALRPVLFRRFAGVPFGDGAAVLAIRKLCHLFTQGLPTAAPSRWSASTTCSTRSTSGASSFGRGESGSTRRARKRGARARHRYIASLETAGASARPFRLCDENVSATGRCPDATPHGIAAQIRSAA